MMLLRTIGRPRILFAPEGEGGASATPTGPTSSAGSANPTSPAAPASPASAPSGASSPAPASSPRPPGGSPQPATAPSQPGEAPDQFEPFDFGSMFGPDTGVTSPTPPSPTPTPVAATGAEAVPTTPPGAAAQPTPAPAPTPTPAAPEPGVTGQQGPQPTAAPSAQPRALDPADPIGLANALAEQEPAMIEHIASSVFKLSPEDIEELETNTVAAVPKLLARAFVKIQQNQLIHLGRVVPQMIQRHTEMMRRNTANEAKFYSRWPDLNVEKHGDLVRRYGATYRQMHPTATLEQMIEDLGPMVMMSAKVVPGSAAQAAAGGTQNPMKAAPQGNGVRPPQPSPFVPAVGGGGQPVMTDPNTEDWSWVQSRE